MNTPSVTEGMGFINYAWRELGLRVAVERYSHDGKAELQFYLANESSEVLLLHTAVNLLSASAMTGLVKRLERNSDSIVWTDILTFLTGKTLAIARRGEPCVLVGNLPAREGATYRIWPFCPEGELSCIFGEGGTGKSFLAVYFGMAVNLGLDNLGLRPERGNVLYLDYESCQEEVNERILAIRRGMGGLPVPAGFFYHHCNRPLVDDIEAVEKLVSEHKVDFLILDSVGMACVGEDSGASFDNVAIRLFRALRSLKVTCLLVDHVAKKEEGKRTPFGSIYKLNEARSVWEVMATPEPGEDELVIGLYHKKANRGRLHPPLAFQLSFSPDSITITAQEVEDVLDLAGRLPLAWRIRQALKGGAKTLAELAEDLGAKEDTIGKTLRRGRDKKFVKLGAKWGLKSQEGADA